MTKRIRSSDNYMDLSVAIREVLPSIDPVTMTSHIQMMGKERDRAKYSPGYHLYQILSTMSNWHLEIRGNMITVSGKGHEKLASLGFRTTDKHTMSAETSEPGYVFYVVHLLRDFDKYPYRILDTSIDRMAPQDGTDDFYMLDDYQY